MVDRTAPVISVSTPSAGAVYGLGESVTADYGCQDEPGGSGLAGCTGTTADGAALDTSSVGEKTFMVEATDKAGNKASKSLTYTVVDQAPPAISLTAPADGAVYSLGQSVVAAYSCEDQPGASGVASCHGTVPSGASVDTSSFGEHSFEVSASDRAGNTSSKIVTYTVAYDFDGFRSPVKNTPNINKWKAGQPCRSASRCAASAGHARRRRLSALHGLRAETASRSREPTRTLRRSSRCSSICPARTST